MSRIQFYRFVKNLEIAVDFLFCWMYNGFAEIFSGFLVLKERNVLWVDLAVLVAVGIEVRRHIVPVHRIGQAVHIVPVVPAGLVVRRQDPVPVGLEVLRQGLVLVDLAVRLGPVLEVPADSVVRQDQRLLRDLLPHHLVRDLFLLRLRGLSLHRPRLRTGRVQDLFPRLRFAGRADMVVQEMAAV